MPSQPNRAQSLCLSLLAPPFSLSLSHSFGYSDTFCLYKAFRILSFNPLGVIIVILVEQMKNKLFLCFRPVTIETETQSNDRAFTRRTVANHIIAKVSVINKSPFSSCESPKYSEKVIHDRKRDTKKKSFSGVVKAVLFEVSLRKKARDRKALQLKVGSKSSDSSESDGISKSPNTNSHSFESSSSSCSSLDLSPNKCCDSQLINLSSLNLKKQSINKESGVSSSKAGLLLILIILSFTIFCGRLCAMLFTWLWLYLMSRRRREIAGR
ncbi:unnamed protein product [Camellia sinensis]